MVLAEQLGEESIMVTWFLNLIQGDFANNPTAWIDLFITVAGIAAAPITWFINSRKAKTEAKTAKDNFDKQLDAIKGQRDEAHKQAESQKVLADSLKSQVDLLTKQLNALQAQAESLREQTDMQRVEYDKAPWGDAEWTGRGGQFLIRNKSTRAVVVTSVHASDRNLDNFITTEDKFPCTYEPGDMIVYFAIGTIQTGTPKTVIEWHWADSDKPRTTTRPNLK